ncbi:MAG: GNAT family N-acetyltransferase [Burkholderiaceae bacterium]|nr:GNAT family N-acetyltransferase [Burkholderiaceae bacterium]
MSFKIAYDRRATSTYAFAILAEAWNEMVQDGLTPDNLGVPPISPDTEVIYAVGKDGDIVGVLAWNHDVHASAYEVTIAYVEPSSRQQGVFAEMIEDLCERAYAAGVAKIVSTVPAGSVAVTAFKQVGGKQVSITYEHKVT